jgi:hypothetical protein
MKKTMHGAYRGHAFDLRVIRLATDPTVADQCWEWPGFTDKGGYAHVNIRRSDGRCTTMVAHKRAYTVLVGRVPKGKQLDHLCRNRRCFNPKHLEPVTCRVNIMRGEGLAAKNAAKTHCKRGHPLEGGNLRSEARGWRLCRQCTREQDRERQKAKRRARGLKCEPRSIPPLKPMAV